MSNNQPNLQQILVRFGKDYDGEGGLLFPPEVHVQAAIDAIYAAGLAQLPPKIDIERREAAGVYKDNNLEQLWYDKGQNDTIERTEKAWQRWCYGEEKAE